eukprot:TRINITY_DN37077_c0_g1_i1.p1 TRINITY_DN37077_c0_g1~~TRINITY_DN37077_c0_g1_i1.p1  ORF type:complete len:120 (+),score=8.44 TRINITY_DN37077_c0_g1_i1:1011-1370(+)
MHKYPGIIVSGRFRTNWVRPTCFQTTFNCYPHLTRKCTMKKRSSPSTFLKYRKQPSPSGRVYKTHPNKNIEEEFPSHSKSFYQASSNMTNTLQQLKMYNQLPSFLIQQISSKIRAPKLQ